MHEEGKSTEIPLSIMERRSAGALLKRGLFGPFAVAESRHRFVGSVASAAAFRSSGELPKLQEGRSTKI